MTRLLLPLLSALLFSLSVKAQQMQEFNQLYAEHERANALKIAKKAVIMAADAGTPGTAYQLARQAADDSMNGKSPAIANEAAAKATDPSSETTSAITAASALPNFTSLLGSNVIVPKIELVGTTNFSSRNNRFYAELRVLTSVIPPKQSTNINLFFPETSAYGISVNANYLPLEELEVQKEDGSKEEVKWVCLYGTMNYLGKSLFGVRKNDNATNDTTRFITDFVHLKLGFQVIPFANFISFYGDINFLAPLANRDRLLQYNPTMKAGFSNFLSVGTKLFLAKGADKPLGLYLDLSFIIVDQVTKTLYATSDPVIPKIAIGSSFRF